MAVYGQRSAYGQEKDVPDQFTLKILSDAFAQNATCRVIIFHESIDQVMALFAMLRERGFPVVAQHSEFPDSMRAESRFFRQGVARWLSSISMGRAE
jgi:superfamily II DNA/RNA helicase